MTYDDIKRTMARNLDIIGTTPARATLHQYYTRDAQWEGWLYETLHAAAIALDDGNKVLAFRCALQAATYQGRLGGTWPTPGTRDAFLTIRQSIEDMIR